MFKLAIMKAKVKKNFFSVYQDLYHYMYVSYGNLLMYPRFFKENGRSPSLPGGGGRIPMRKSTRRCSCGSVTPRLSGETTPSTGRGDRRGRWICVSLVRNYVLCYEIVFVAMVTAFLIPIDYHAQTYFVISMNKETNKVDQCSGSQLNHYFIKQHLPVKPVQLFFHWKYFLQC